ncbi:MAG: iron-sulfur cluster assembly accessory protein [Alphaproteobacteria bacterium]|nr:MAG: iron-sulfur cluster assembly accessory protein [Alphaproteobacteria bacterium]
MPSPALPPPIIVTETAARRVAELLARRDPPATALLLGVGNKGCSGLSYTMTYVDQIPPHADVVECHGARIALDPAASLYLIGTTMDWKEDKLRAGFVFLNPNETGKCGCGESFSVAGG